MPLPYFWIPGSLAMLAPRNDQANSARELSKG